MVAYTKIELLIKTEATNAYLLLAVRCSNKEMEKGKFKKNIIEIIKNHNPNRTWDNHNLEVMADEINVEKLAEEITNQLLDIDWNDVECKLPEDNIPVLCYHIHSGNYFICYRTTDCLTHEPKWQGGAMPTHWKFLDKPISNDR